MQRGDWVGCRAGGCSGGVLGLRLLEWQLERSLELKRECGTESQLGNQWQKGRAKVKLFHRRDLERRDKGSDQNFDKYSC